MADKNAKIREKFLRLFKIAFARGEATTRDRAAIKKMENDYEELKFFVNGIKKVDQIDACLDEYLKIYTNYFPSDRRSKFLFALLLEHRIDGTKEDDRYIDDLSRILADNKRPFRSALRSRYEDIEDREKKEIQAALKYKKQGKKQRPTVLDELKNAYYNTHTKEPTTADLLEFNSAPDPELKKQFNALHKSCRDAWDKKDAGGIDDPLKNFMMFVYHQKDCLRVFQIAKWCRDIVRGNPRVIVIGGKVEKRSMPSDDLDRELYFQSVYWLFRHSLDHGYAHNYSGFKRHEIEFFFDPLSSFYYYENWLNRYQAATKKADKFKESSILFIRLLMFARLNNAVMVNNQDASRIKKIRETIPENELKKKSFKLDVGRELLRGDIKIEAKAGKVVLKYFEKITGNTTRDLYVEFVGLEDLLFAISKSTWANFYEDSFYDTVWMNTRGLLRLIPAMFALLGYTFSFITGGASALAMDVVIDVAIGEIAEEANLGTGGTVALQLLGSLAASPVVGSPKGGVLEAGVVEAEGLGRSLNRGLGSATDDLRALKGAGNVLDTEVRAVKPAQKVTSGTEALHMDERLLGGKENLAKMESRGVGKVQKKGKSYMASATNDAVNDTKASYVAAYERGTTSLPGPPEHFPFGGGGQPMPKPEMPDRLFRIMSVAEAAESLKTGKIPVGISGTMGSKFLSLDSKYVMLFREKELEDLAQRAGKKIASQETNLSRLENRIAMIAKDNPGRAAELRGRLKNLQVEIERTKNQIKADAGPVIQDWFAAPGQKVVVEIQVAPGAIDNMLKRAVPEKLISQYQDKDVFIWKFERGYGRNLAVPPWQLDAFNKSIVKIRMIGDRGLNLFGATKTPPLGMN